MEIEKQNGCPRVVGGAFLQMDDGSTSCCFWLHGSGQTSPLSQNSTCCSEYNLGYPATIVMVQYFSQEISTQLEFVGLCYIYDVSMEWFNENLQGKKPSLY